jgi:acyl carrier protein
VPGLAHTPLNTSHPTGEPTEKGATVYEEMKELLIVSVQVPADKITPEASLEDLEFDSLELVELTLALEEKFGVQLRDEEIVKLWRIGAIVEAVTARGAKVA